ASVTNTVQPASSSEAVTTSRAADPASFELSYWETIKSSSEPQDFISYLEKYPQGQFVELARRRAGSALSIAAESHNKKGDEFWEAKNFVAAEPEYRAAIFFNPDKFVYHNNLAATLTKEGKPGEPEERREAKRLQELELKQAVALKPDDKYAHGALADYYKKNERLSEAEAEYKEALRLENYASGSTWSSELFYIYKGQKRYAEAEALLREQIKQNTPAVRGSYYYAGHDRANHQYLADFLEQQNRLPEAETEFREALRLEPDNFSLVASLSEVLAKQKRVKEGVNEWKGLIKRKPDKYAHFYFARFLTKHEMWPEAEAEYRESL